MRAIILIHSETNLEFTSKIHFPNTLRVINKHMKGFSNLKRSRG